MGKRNKYPVALERANNFRRLVAGIRKIDRQAADYLLAESKREGSCFHSKVSGGGRCCYLLSLMEGAKTPQGHDYWSDIAYKIKHGW